MTYPNLHNFTLNRQFLQNSDIAPLHRAYLLTFTAMKVNIPAANEQVPDKI